MEEKIVLVTGGAGFVGSHLCARLAREGYRVIALDNYFAGSLTNHIPHVEYREGHTKNITLLAPERPEIIFHLGEYSRVEQSVFEPDLVHDLNTLGTRAVVAYWQEMKCKLVYAGSSTKFGDGGLTRDTSPYARTKAENTELIKKVGDEHGLPYAITYFYNVFGPGERSGTYGTAIELFKEMYMRGAPIGVVSPGTQKRNFTHVEDIVNGLILVGEKGHGDEYGIGNDKAYTVLDVARMFGDEIIMLPERQGNRMGSELMTNNIRALGWVPTHSLETYVHDFLQSTPRGTSLERRVLVFSTTLFPTGPAERALLALIKKMPDVQFDVITTAFSKKDRDTLPRNMEVHMIGLGLPTDKYFLPLFGAWRARRLCRVHRYLFSWSIMASYAALAAVIAKRTTRVPLLVSLADQNIANLSYTKKKFILSALTEADQVHGTQAQEKDILDLAASVARRSLGHGDAFANQMRLAYQSLLRRDTISS